MDEEIIRYAIAGCKAEYEAKAKRTENYIKGLKKDLEYCMMFAPKGIWDGYDLNKTAEENYAAWCEKHPRIKEE